MNKDQIDPKTCPLCGKPNNCHLHQTEAGDCWCINATIPNELIEQVPEHLKNKACICKSCVDAYNAQNR